MYSYPAKLTKDDEGWFNVSFRDVPEALTSGETFEEAAMMAADALETALSFYVEQRIPLPQASKIKSGETVIHISALGMAKAALYTAMLEQKVSRAELARRLGWHLAQVQRALDFCHASKLEQIETALAALGLRMVVNTMKAA
jgi:antitoxin HicB